MDGPLSKYGAIYGHLGHRVSTRGGVFAAEFLKIPTKTMSSEKIGDISAEFEPFRDLLNVLELI